MHNYGYIGGLDRILAGVAAQIIHISIRRGDPVN